MTTETKQVAHSPGPWEIASYENYYGYSIWAKGAGCIAERWYPSEHEDAPILANARLIAAAPELLKESRNVIAEFFEEYEYEENAPTNSKTIQAIRRLQAAICKATESQ